MLEPEPIALLKTKRHWWGMWFKISNDDQNPYTNFNELQIWVSHMWGLKVISTFIRNYVHLFSFIKSSYRKIWKWRYLRFWRKITSTGLRRQSLLNNTTTGPLIVALYTKKVLLVSGTSRQIFPWRSYNFIFKYS